MKRILITGAGSYLGTNVEAYLKEYCTLHNTAEYQVDTVSQRSDEWKALDFGKYDSVFHVTGIAHADVSKVTEEEKQQYYSVNCELAVETAKKAKAEGVRQFIYMSSIIVYGESAPIGKKKCITRDTEPAPANFYGDSKLQAEYGLGELRTDDFQVAIVRAPFLYGRGCKGNYVQLAKMARKSPVFPTLKNERSMLYVENFCEFIRLLIESERGGIFYPQNKEYSSTDEMIKVIAACHGKKIRFCRWMNPFVKLSAKCPGKIGKLAGKAFGSISYEQSISHDIGNYQIYSFQESIERTECEADKEKD